VVRRTIEVDALPVENYTIYLPLVFRGGD